MAYKGPYIVKLSISNDGNCYISRGTKRLQLPCGELYTKAIDALVSAKITHESDHLVEHWIDEKWVEKSAKVK